MRKEFEEYIKNIEKQIEDLGVKVNDNGNVSSNSIFLIQMNGEKAKELTAQLRGFKDALRLMGELN